MKIILEVISLLTFIRICRYMPSGVFVVASVACMSMRVRVWTTCIKTLKWKYLDVNFNVYPKFEAHHTSMRYIPRLPSLCVTLTMY